MLIYNLLLLAVVALGIAFCEIRYSKSNNIIFLIITSVLMIIISYLRADTVGYDYINYANYFVKVHNGGWRFLVGASNGYRIEFGYSLLNYLVSVFTGDVHVFMMAVAIIVVGLTAVLLYKYSSIPWIGMFLFVSFGFFGVSLCTIRQTIATAIYMFAIQFLKNKKFLPYLLIVLAAASFHKAMLVMIPIYFIANIKVNWKSLSVYGILTVILSAAVWPIFNFITKYAFQYYATQDGLYFMNERDWQTAAVPVLTMIITLFLKNFILKRDSKNIVLINFSIYSGLLYILTCQHFLFQRFAMMFFTSTILLIPELLAGIKPNADDEQINAPMTEKNYFSKGQHKENLQLRRTIKVKQKIQRHIYYYAVATVIFVGFLYNIWTLLQNRLHLIPYTTFSKF